MGCNEWIDRIRATDIVLFGAGNYARQFYSDFKDKLNIIKCITNNPSEKEFVVDGVKVCSISRVEECLNNPEKRQFIVCASARASEMENQLWQFGLIPGRDFCSCDLIRLILSEKKIAILYGVCYMRAITDCLKKSACFLTDYEIYYSLSYMVRSAYEDAFLKFLLSICNLYLYNATLSPSERRKQEELERCLSGNAKKISIPVILSSAYYPQVGQRGQWSNPYGIISSKTRWGSFTSPDQNINRMLNNNLSVDEIVGIISDDRYYDYGDIQENYDKELISIRLADEIAEIKIYDYIADNRGNKRLFINESHISNHVIIELSRRILACLGYKDDIPEETLLEAQLINASEIPLYPSVIKALGLTIYKDNPVYRLFTFNEKTFVTLDEYIRRYCDYCGNMMRFMEMGYYPS